MQRQDVAPWAASSSHRMTQAPPVTSGSRFRLGGAWESTDASPRPHWGQDRPRRTLERLCAPGFPGNLVPRRAPPCCPPGLGPHGCQARAWTPDRGLEPALSLRWASWVRVLASRGREREGTAQGRDSAGTALPTPAEAGHVLRARVSAAWCLCCPPPPTEPHGEPTPPTSVQGSWQHLGLCARVAPHWDSLPRDTRSTTASQTLAIRAHLRPPSRGSPHASIQGLSEAKARACSAATQGAMFDSLWTFQARGLWTWLVGPLPK
ncbi:unnamed protein product [Nyctereutes procyonoides]|uniref:(raccoon dog) hypothetical protein n=1 Tax=Nyctereutes procyonoides TaxID=34880 RepID=A0A811XV38_NYCPR|nr:unnamed protein product [Nyctereutes procyonoides]